MRRELKLAATAAGVRIVGTETEPASPATTRRAFIAAAVEYLAEIEEHREAKTYAAYSKSMLSFAESVMCEKKVTIESFPTIDTKLCIEDLTRSHALAWIAELQKKGNQPHTPESRDTPEHVHASFWVALLAYRKRQAQVTKKKVLAYNEQVLARMFERATEDEKDLLYFFHCTGAREGDASAACWSDVDLTQKLYKVTEHLYRRKDKEEEPLPLPDLLIERLKARRTGDVLLRKGCYQLP
jgi:integrase/recombinase XerD